MSIDRLEGSEAERLRIDQVISDVEEFVQQRLSPNSQPIRSYEELQEVIRGQIDLPSHLIEIVKNFGVAGENSQGSRIVHLSKMVGKHRIVAEVNNIGSLMESVLIYEQRRTLPFVRYQSKKLLDLHARYRTFDRVQQYGVNKFVCRPEIEKEHLEYGDLNAVLDIITVLTEQTLLAVQN